MTQTCSLSSYPAHIPYDDRGIGLRVRLNLGLRRACRLLAGNVRRLYRGMMDRMSAELIAQRCQHFHAEAVGLARAETHVERERDHGCGHGVLDALHHGPAPLA